MQVLLFFLSCTLFRNGKHKVYHRPCSLILLSHSLIRDVYRWSLLSFPTLFFICVTQFYGLRPVYLFPPCRLYTNVSQSAVYYLIFSVSFFSSSFFSVSSTFFVYLLYKRYFYFLMVCLGRAKSTYRYRLDASHDIQPVDFDFNRLNGEHYHLSLTELLNFKIA
jgi:hypothetical protein